MNEWKTYRLSEIVELIGGGTPRTSNPEYWNGNIPWLSVADFNTGRKYVSLTEKTISEKGLNESSTKLLKPGDIIISARGTVGVVAVLDKSMAFNQSCYGVRANISLSTNDYIYYLLKDTIPGFLQIAHGGVFATITRDTFYEIDVSLPPLPEQTAISSILSSLDDKIDLLHRQNATLEKMAETLFRQWFVEEAKEDWDEGTLDDILTVKGGATPSTSEPTYWNGNIHWTSPKDITNLNGIYLFDTERKITELGLSKISSGLLPKGTLLMSSRAPVGVLAFCEVPVAINQGYIAILDNKGYSKEFIYLWLKANMDVVHSFSNGSTFMEISKSAFKTLQLQIPPKQVTQDFQLIVEPLFNKIKSNNIQIRTLTALRDTLLPKLISGEVRVEV